MAQKSLPALHRIDTSMTWYSTLLNKRYKWLSNNYWHICFFLFKVLNFIKLNSQSHWKYNHNNNKKKLKIEKKRFKNFVNLFLIDFDVYIILINISFMGNLRFFKNWKNNKIIKNNIYFNNTSISDKSLYFKKYIYNSII